MRGVPVRIELGPRDIENNVCVVVRRDTGEKQTIELSKLKDELETILEDIQKSMFEACKKHVEERTTVAKTLEEFEKNINENQGYIKTMWCGDVECEDKIKELTGAHSRCMPFNQEHISDTCVVCGKENELVAVGSCDHRRVCSYCAMKSRLHYDYKKCPICLQVLDQIFICEFTDKTPYSTLVKKKDEFYEDEEFDKSHIYYTSIEGKEEALKLRGFNCPLRSCHAETFENINSLSEHLNKVHKRFYCPYCLKENKTFLSEMNIYNKANLEDHIKYGEYESMEEMEHDTISLSNYIYNEINNKFYVYIGITNDKDNLVKLTNYFSKLGYNELGEGLTAKAIDRMLNRELPPTEPQTVPETQPVIATTPVPATNPTPQTTAPTEKKEKSIAIPLIMLILVFVLGGYIVFSIFGDKWFGNSNNNYNSTTRDNTEVVENTKTKMPKIIK